MKHRDKSFTIYQNESIKCGPKFFIERTHEGNTMKLISGNYSASGLCPPPKMIRRIEIVKEICYHSMQSEVFMPKVLSSVIFSILSFPAFGKTSVVQGNLFTASCPTQASYATNLITIQQVLMASPEYKKLLQEQEKEALQGFQFSSASVNHLTGTIQYYFNKSVTNASGWNCLVSLSFQQHDCRSQVNQVTKVTVPSVVCTDPQDD